MAEEAARRDHSEVGLCHKAAGGGGGWGGYIGDRWSGQATGGTRFNAALCSLLVLNLLHQAVEILHLSLFLSLTTSPTHGVRYEFTVLGVHVVMSVNLWRGSGSGGSGGISEVSTPVLLSL